MEIRNKTRRPLRISLPGGKRLHLGPAGTGQISPKAAEHPPVKKLIEADEIEILDGGLSQGTGSSGSKSAKGSSSGGSHGGGVRHTGDR